MFGLEATVVRGHEGLLGYVRDLDEGFSVRDVQFSDFRDLGDRIVALGHVLGRGRESGIEFDSPYGGLRRCSRTASASGTATTSTTARPSRPPACWSRRCRERPGSVRCRRSTPWGSPYGDERRDSSGVITRRLITAVAVVMAFAAATAYAAVTPIPPSEYPHGCHPNGEALQGDAANDFMDGTAQRDLLRGGPDNDGLLGYEQKIVCSDSRVWTRSTAGAGTTGFGAAGVSTSWKEAPAMTSSRMVVATTSRLRASGAGTRSTAAPALITAERSLRLEAGFDMWRRSWGAGRDRIVDAKGHNDINCGKGSDTVVTNEKSHVEKCEHVTRR